MVQAGESKPQLKLDSRKNYLSGLDSRFRESLNWFTDFVLACGLNH